MKQLSRILLIDDDEISNFVTQKFLEQFNLCDQLITLTNGLEAVEYLSQNGNPIPDLILLDINMPLMNGFEFLNWCKANSYTGQSRVAIYTTSRHEQDVNMAARFKDVIGYITKPISQGKIEEVIAKI